MFNFVFAGFDAKIKINNNFFNVKKNRLQPVDETFESVTIFAPHCQEALFVPYTINKNECATFKYGELNTNIYALKPNYFLKQNGTTTIYESDNISASFIARGKCFLKICDGEQTYIACFAELCKNPQTISCGNFIVVYANNLLCDGYSIVVFDLNTKTFCFNSTAYEIKQDGNEICLLDYPVITGAAKAHIYNLAHENFNTTETYYVKLFNPEINEGNVPILLFYAVKTKDFNFAKSLLSSALQESATNEMLESYFLPYSDMYKNPFKNSSYILVNNTSLCDIEFNLTRELLVDNFSKK